MTITRSDRTKQYRKQIENDMTKYFIDFITKHPETEYKWQQLSKNILISIEIVKLFIDNDWNWNLFSAKIKSLSSHARKI